MSNLPVYNEFQTPLTEELLATYPQEVIDNYFKYTEQTPFIKNLISPDRKRAKDLERDAQGKIIVDIINPHILENMDYFRESAIHYQKYGVFTKLKVDLRKQSNFMKWYRREVSRCLYGMLRKEDGEWVTGPLYYYLNYFPIVLTKHDSNNNPYRDTDLPLMWEGVYLRFHYWHQAKYGGLYNNFTGGQHCIEVAARGKSKSYSMASLATRNFRLGISKEERRNVRNVIVAETKEYLDKDGILNKFEDALSFSADHTYFPSSLLKASWSDYSWIAGYKQDTKKGSLNSVLGIPIDANPNKVRGKRSAYILFEEIGAFSNFISTWVTADFNVSVGNSVFGQKIGSGTGGSEGHSFAGALEMIHHPEGYGVYALPNVYDLASTGSKTTVFYFPSIMNYEGYYNSNGVSNITGAIWYELMARYKLKYNSSDPNILTQRIAENSIVLKEAIMNVKNSAYNTAAIQDQINYLDTHPEVRNNLLVGRMRTRNGIIEFDPTADVKEIDIFPLKTNKVDGAVVIKELPIKDNDGEIITGRYIAGADVYDDDESSTLTLISILVMDLFTDEIVAEYTGRLAFADDTYEQVRLLTMFYNAELNYENNKKGLFTYFSKMKSIYTLSPTLDILKDKDMVKESYGNKAYGTPASAGIKAYGRRIGRDYLNSPHELVKEVDGVLEAVTVRKVASIPFRAFLQELSMWDGEINTDRHDAFVMLMLLRENKLRLYGEDVQSELKAEDSFAGDRFVNGRWSKYSAEYDHNKHSFRGMTINEIIES